MPAFEFVTTWRLGAPLAEVWDALSCAVCWPQWWRGIESVRELEPGDEDGVGQRDRFVWRGPLPYRLRFDIRITSIVPLEMIAGAASGDVAGAGIWRFSRDQGDTLVRYEWSVRTDKWWLSALAGFASPVVVWNHNRAMRWGGAGLAGFLGVKLLEAGDAV